GRAAARKRASLALDSLMPPTRASSTTANGLCMAMVLPNPRRSGAHASVERVEEGVQLGRLGEDVRGDADAAHVAGNADIAGGTLADDALEVALDRLEAHQAGVKGVATCVGLAQPRMASDALPYPAGHFVDAPVNAPRADGLEEIQRRFEADHDGQVRGAKIGEAVGLAV